jgi:nucleoside-diphosphate-sugar epimerase
MSSLVPTIPEGSLILVTGATGFVASHTVAQLLQRGYKVRGTVRSLEGASWLTNDVFKSAAESGNLELVAVPDLSAPHAFDESVKNVAGIIHVATITDLNPDPNVTVPRTVSGVSTILEAAVKEPSVKEFVYTGSGLAATSSYKGNKTHVGRDTWNDAVVQYAWSPPPYGPERAFPVYAASKVAAEKEVWRFVDEEKPHFTVNVVSPSGIIGRPLHRKHADSPIAWITHLWNGAAEALKPIYARKHHLSVLPCHQCLGEQPFEMDANYFCP